MNHFTDHSHRRSRRSGIAWAIALVIVAIILPSPGGWTIDDGVKYSAALEGQGVWADVIPDGPVRTQLSDAAAFPPLHLPFAQRVDNGFAPGFAPTTRAYFKLFGGNAAALRVSVAICVILLWILMERKGLRYAFLLLPLTFYGLVPWEHGLSWLLLWPIVWMALGHEQASHQRTLGMGVLAGIAVLLRPEAAVLSAVIASYLLFRKRFAAAGVLTAGIVIILGGFAALYAATGTESPLTHLQLNLSGKALNSDWFTERIRAGTELLLRMDRNTLTAVALLNIFLFAFTALSHGEAQGKRGLRMTGVVLLAVWCGVYQYRLWSHPLPPLALLGANSIFTAMPWAAVLLRPPYHGRPALLIAMTSIIVMLALLPVWNGVHWGPRLLLFVIPLLVVDLYQTKRAQGFAFGVLLAVTVVQTASSGWLAYARGKELADHQRRVETKLGNVVICPTMSQCADLAPLWRDREFFTAVNPRELRQLLIEFRRSGVDTCWLHLDAHDRLYVESFPEAKPVWPHQMTVLQAGSLYKTQWRVYELVMSARDTTWAAILQAEAGAMLREDQPEHALEIQTEALALVPQSAQAHHNRALILRGMGHRAEARTEAARALELDPDLTEARRLWEDLSRPNGAARADGVHPPAPDREQGTE